MRAWWLVALFGTLAACVLELDAEIACGDGFVDRRAGEQCDPGNELSYVGMCMNDRAADCDEVTCQLDLEACFDACGNGVVDEGEECDPRADLDDLVAAGGKDCQQLDPDGAPDAYVDGVSTRCLSDCRWDRSQCNFCGDDRRQAAFGEVCDGSDIDPDQRHDLCYARCRAAEEDPAPTSVRCQVRCADDCNGLEVLEDPRCCLPSGETRVSGIDCCNPPAPGDPTKCGPGLGG